MTPKQHAAQQAVADRINDAIAPSVKTMQSRRVMRALRTLIKTVAVVIIALVLMFAFTDIKVDVLGQGVYIH